MSSVQTRDKELLQILDAKQNFKEFKQHKQNVIKQAMGTTIMEMMKTRFYSKEFDWERILLSHVINIIKCSRMPV